MFDDIKQGTMYVDGSPVFSFKVVTPNEIYQRVCDTYGVDAQLTKAIEELSELIKEICKDKSGEGKSDQIAEEVADVEIMCEQLRFIYDFDKAVDKWKEYKLKRLAKRLEDREE